MNLADGNVFVVTDQKSRTELRVCGLLRDADGMVSEVGLVDFRARKFLPPVPVSQVDEHLENGDWVLLGAEQEADFDLKQRHIRSLDDVPSERRSRFGSARDANLRLIKPLLDLGWGVFDSAERGRVLAEIEEKHQDGKSRSKRWANALLVRYLLSGKNPNALGPQSHRAGAKSRRAMLEAGLSRKLGRRTGPNRKVDVDYRDGTRTDRGGNAILLSAIKPIESIIASYLKDPSNQSKIRISKEQWKGLPWTSITKAVNLELGRFPGFRKIRVTRRQVAYLGMDSVDHVAVVRRAYGSRHTNMNHRRLDGDYRDVARFAGQRYEADTLLVDLHLVDDVTGMPIGRLRIYLIVDVFSGFVTGVYSTVNEIDNAHVGRAFHAAFAPKVEFCRLFGLEIKPEDWPCEGLPESIGADNKELVAQAAKYLPELIDVGIARPYRGDDKGTVESGVNLLQLGHVHLYGEGVTKGPKQRCTDDPAKLATASVSTFMRELLRWVVYTHNHRALPKTRQIPPAFLKTRQHITPFNIWNWSRRRRGGALRRYNPAAMMPRLLPGVDAPVTSRGIAVEGLYFELPKELDRLRAASTCVRGDKVRVRVHWDPLSTNQVYLVPHDLAMPIVRCPLTRFSRYSRDLSWPEKELRDRHVWQIRELTCDAAIRREEGSTEELRKSVRDDAKKLKAVYGSKAARAAFANDVSLEAIKEYQAESDNRKLAAYLHGPLTPPDLPDGLVDQPVNDEPPKNPKRADDSTEIFDT